MFKSCRDCGQRIRLVQAAETGQWIPIDAYPSRLNGSIDIRGGKAVLLPSAEAVKLRAEGRGLYTTHRFSCAGASGRDRLRPNAGLVEVRSGPKRQLELGIG
jgi:hypothetical protein